MLVPFSRPTSACRVLLRAALALTVGALALERVPEARQESGPVTEREIVAACGSCHDVPPPNILPRAAWRPSFERMAVIRTGKPQVAEPPSPPQPIELPEDMRRVLLHFERMAPERLPPPERWPDARPAGFVRRSIAAPESFRDAPPTIANVRLVDLDANGRLEVIATDMRHGLVLRGRPYRADERLEVVASVPHPARIAVADFEGTGQPGFLVGDLGRLLPGDHQDGAIVWLRPAGGGKYVQQALEGWPRVADVRAADFDGNGVLDLAVAAFGWRTVGRIAVLENRLGPGGQRAMAEHLVDPRPGAIDVIPVDLNQDGRLDLVALLSQHYETVVAYLNRPTPPFSFDPVVLYKAPHANWGSSGIQVVDLDGDGDLDILLSNGDSFDDAIVKPYHGIHWLDNRGGLTFLPHRLAGMPGVHRAQAADLDGDGDLDVIASALLAAGSDRDESQLPAVVWLEQRSRGVFERRTLSMGMPRHATIDAGDFDRDGDTDIVVGVMAPDGNGARWLDVWENQREKR